MSIGSDLLQNDHGSRIASAVKCYIAAPQSAQPVILQKNSGEFVRTLAQHNTDPSVDVAESERERESLLNKIAYI